MIKRGGLDDRKLVLDKARYRTLTEAEGSISELESGV